MTLFLFTDGAVSRSGYGGWACIAVRDGEELWRRSGGTAPTTNNRMELTGILYGLSRAVTYTGNVVVVTDSRYAIGAITKSHKRLKPTNIDLIRQACQLAATLRPRLKFEWVKGHSGHHWNELADKLAVSARTAYALA